MKALRASGFARSVLFTGVALGSITAAAPLAAQETVAEDDGDRSEIVVTARRRDEDIQSVPISINAYSVGIWQNATSRRWRTWAIRRRAS